MEYKECVPLAMEINFVPSRGNNEKHQKACKKHFKSEHKQFMVGNDTDEITEKLFQLPLHNYLMCLETLMRGSKYVFSHADSPDSNMDSPD